MSHHHAPENGGAPVLDQQALDALADLGGEEARELLDELIELYLEDAPSRMEVLVAAADDGDTVAVAKGAHSLKSASANLGALPFASECKELERAANAGEPVEHLVQRAAAMFDEVCGALRARRQG